MHKSPRCILCLLQNALFEICLSEAAQSSTDWHSTAQYGLFLQVEREKYLPVTVLVTGQPLLCSFKSEKKPDDRNKKVNIFITSSLMTKIVDCRFTSSFVVVFAGVKKGKIFISC